MRIGIISEGHSDRAVISNIIIGVTGLKHTNILPLRPIYTQDETDKAIYDPLTYSSWSIVKSECKTRKLIDEFLSIEGQEFVVIHIDTAEASEYGITKPQKDSDYCSALRKTVINKINEWLAVDLNSEILYAIAIEETDAWLLTLFSSKDTSKSQTAKEKLKFELRPKGINSTVSYENYLELSKPFSKSKELKKRNFLKYNKSLELFYNEIKDKIIPKLP